MRDFRGCSVAFWFFWGSMEVPVQSVVIKEVDESLSRAWLVFRSTLPREGSTCNTSELS